MKLLIQFFGTCPLLVSLSLLACIGFAAYALQLAPPAHQPFELELRFSYQLANSLFGGGFGEPSTVAVQDSCNRSNPNGYSC